MTKLRTRKWVTALALIGIGSGSTAHAATLDLRATAASEDVFRGIVQTGGLAGSLRADARYANRAYLGSRLLNNRSAGGAQIDAWAGATKTLLVADLIAVDLEGGLSASLYTGDRRGPEGRDLDWAEGYASIGGGPLRAGLSFAPDYFGTGAAAWRLSGQLRWPLATGTEATAVVGWNEGAGIGRHLARRGGDARYADYMVGLSRALPADFTIYGQITGASIRLDGSARPRYLIGLRWRWGRQLSLATGR
jgi:hypothetical protein